MDKILQGHLVFDGGFSTELVSHGHDSIDGDPLWSARLLSTNNDAIVQVHKSFLQYNADVIISGTYQASIDGLVKYLGCSVNEAEQLIRKGGKLVRNARDEYWDQYLNSNKESEQRKPTRCFKPLACASMGPYGAFLGDGSEYNGKYVNSVSLKELKKFHSRRLALLAEENLDLYLFETIPALKEASAIIDVIKEYPDLKFIISFSCKDASCISHGELFSDGVKMLEQTDQVVAIGVNCTSPIVITPLLNSIKGLTKKKILVMANSGEIWKDKSWSTNNEIRPFKSYINEWIDAGANWIGGCCRTTPDDMRFIRKTFDSRS